MTPFSSRTFSLVSALLLASLAVACEDSEGEIESISPGNSAGSSAKAGSSGANAGQGGTNAGQGGASAGSSSGGKAGNTAAGSGGNAGGEGGASAGGQGGTSAGGNAGSDVGGSAGSEAGGSNGGSGEAGSGGSDAGSGQGGEAGSGQAGSGTAGGGGSEAAGSGSSGQAGSGGSAAGSSTGGSSSGGTSSGGSGQGGSSTGGSSTGGSGQGGTSVGGSSSGGSGGQGSGVDFAKIGSACDSDAQCGAGALCLKASGTKLLGGGPADGLCTVDCSAWLKKPVGADPCIENPDANTPANAYCVNYGTDAAPVGYCMQACTQGEPPGMTLSPNKCFGREEVACFSETNAQGVATRSYCQPQCATDAQCGGGLQCDQRLGVCKASAPTAKKTGELCDVTKAGQCEGVCALLYSPTDPQTPLSKKNYGICADPCVFGASAACGGESVGFCGLNVFTPIDPDTGTVGALGAGDLGGCIEVTTSTGDAKCLWQEGWFAASFDGLPPLCLPAKPCPKGAADCAGTGLTCRKVDAVCGRSFCLDHDVKGLPLNDPSVNCDPGQGG